MKIVIQPLLGIFIGCINMIYLLGRGPGGGGYYLESVGFYQALLILVLSVIFGIIAILYIKRKGSRVLLPIRKLSVAVLIIGGLIVAFMGILLELETFIEISGIRPLLLDLHIYAGNAMIGAVIVHIYANSVFPILVI